ncbi:MAG: signal peptidase I [Spirochaetes bacterium]|nr:signal peptidase I [Spirochaetota bacterium]
MPKYDYYKKKVNKKKIFTEIIYIYIITVILVLLFNSLVFQAYKVPSNSMHPSIQENDLILVNKFNVGPRYPITDIKVFDGTKNIKRGEIIVFMSEEYYFHRNFFFRTFSNFLYTITFSIVDLADMKKKTQPNILVKRVIGLPGDKIRFEIKNNSVVTYINGIAEKELITVNYKIIEETIKNSPLLDSMILKNEITVPENQYFVLGDNRISSSDSRIWGSVQAKQIIGKAVFCYFPFSNFGFIK